MQVIQTKGLSKQFKTSWGIVDAVKDLNLEVHSGEIFGFLGPNGAGKTTSMRMLTTLLKPSGGEATIVGYDLLAEPNKVRERIGYVSQAGGLEGDATARENLVLQGRLYHMSKAEAQTQARKLIGAFKLESFADRLTNTYSGGQKRRVDLAMGMIHNPLLLFMDEPTVGLDPQSRAYLWDQVRALRDTGTTIFITTHYLDEADALCDRLAIVDGGKIIVEGTPRELKHQIAGDSVTLKLAPDKQAQAFELLRAQSFVREISQIKGGLHLYIESGEKDLPMILRILDAHTIALEAIALAHPTLDDVFLHYTGRSLRESKV